MPPYTPIKDRTKGQMSYTPLKDRVLGVASDLTKPIEYTPLNLRGQPTGAFKAAADLGTAAGHIITEPGTTLLKPGLEKLGVPAGAAAAAGLLGDIAAPLPGGKVKAAEKLAGEAPKLIDSLADFIVGTKKQWESLTKKATELDQRVAAGSERRSRDISRGADAIKYRLANEIKWQGIPEAQVDTIRRFVSDVGDSMFDDVGLSIRANGGKQGQFNYGTEIITLFRNNIERQMRSGGSTSYSHATIHEMWHVLSRHLPSEELSSVSKAFDRELASYVSKNPWFKVVKDNPRGLSPEQYKEFSEQFPKQAGLWRQEDAGPYVFRGWGKETYRFKHIDEWFAESLTDKSLERFARMDENARSIFLHAKNLLHSFIETVQRMFGRDVAGRILDNFLGGKYEDLVRVGPLNKEITQRAILEQ